MKIDYEWKREELENERENERASERVRERENNLLFWFAISHETHQTELISSIFKWGNNSHTALTRSYIYITTNIQSKWRKKAQANNK